MNKFEKDFKEWYFDNYPNVSWDSPSGDATWLRWNELPFSFQWGVYLMFFDSVGIDLDIRQIAGFRCFSAKVNGAFVGNKIGENHKYRQQAQEEAIKKAKLIYEGL